MFSRQVNGPVCAEARPASHRLWIAGSSRVETRGLKRPYDLTRRVSEGKSGPQFFRCS